jgi:hypothetical protein
MFRVHDREKNYQVFTQKDPREDGCKEEVEAVVALDYSQDVHLHEDGEGRPEVVIGMTGPKAYKVFKYDRERELAGAQRIAGSIIVCYSWTDYLENRPAAYDNSHNA